MHQQGEISRTGAQPVAPLALRLLPLLVLIAASLVIWLSGGLDYLSLQQLLDHRQALTAWVSAHHLTALLAFMGIYTLVVALSLPAAALLTVAGGLFFGWFVGGVATVIAATVGSVVVFLFARTALADTLARRAGPWLDKLRAGFQDDAISYLLFLRLVPAFPFWLVNLAPALLGVRLCDYVIATFIGIIPGTFAFSLAGAGLDSVLAAQKAAYDQCLAQNLAPGACSVELDPSCWLTPELIAAFVALGVIALIPPIAKRVWKRKAAT
jgi:uncharacterized membrane protein YdjX (TVP38/TMEM64 family)